MSRLTAERLKELLSYNPETGEFRWNGGNGWRAVERIAGSLSDRGYVCIKVDGRTYKAHRLAWLYVHDEWPGGVIDHINQRTGDNRICNLRDTTRTVNGFNRQVLSSNSSGYTGVSFEKGKWCARITDPRVKRRRFLGSFETASAAASAYNSVQSEIMALIG